MAKKNLPPRDSKGRFVSRRSYRRNPVGGDLLGMLTGGAIEAGQILVGKAAARSVPDLAGLPKQGNTGLAIQAAVALGLGYVADMFVSPTAARALLAGGLTAPLETLVVAYEVPWFSRALAPTTAGADLGAYVSTARRGDGMGAYVPRRSSPAMEANGQGAGDGGSGNMGAAFSRRGHRPSRGRYSGSASYN